MTKIAVLGFLLLAEVPDEPQPGPGAKKRTPTLDELFAHAFHEEKREDADSPWNNKKHGPIFTQ